MRKMDTTATSHARPPRRCRKPANRLAFALPAPARAHDSGVAIIMVLVVLMALVVIATPFSISMRGHGESAADMLHRKRALKECETLRNIAFERLKETHPHLDLVSPYHDDVDEIRSDLSKLDLGFNTADPKGKIWSLTTEDLQGRINLNGISIYLIANLLNERSWLGKKVDGDVTQLEVSSTEGFPSDGYLWIEGEPLEYASKTEDTFHDIDRAVEVAALKNSIHGQPPDHPSGAEVLGYRSFLIATWCYKWRGGDISFLPTVESIRNISIGNEISLPRDDFDLLRDKVTVCSGYPLGRRFVNPQRVLGFDREDRTVLEVEDGRFMGPGSIVRIRRGEDVHYSMVLLTHKDFYMGAMSWKLLLQDPVGFQTQAGDTGIIDVLARPAVNINTASVEVLAALMTGLSLSSQGKDWVGRVVNYAQTEMGDKGVDPVQFSEEGEGQSNRGSLKIAPGTAGKIALALKRAPVRDYLELYTRLSELTPETDHVALTYNQIWAVMLNALNSNDAYLAGGTAPFCFSSEGCFEVRSAVSDNYPESGREMAHQFMRDIAWVAPSGPLLAVFAAQREFEEQRRLAMEGRHYATFPNPVDVVGDSVSIPSVAPALMTDGIAAAEESEDSFVQLAPLRTPGSQCLHFDAADRPYHDLDLMSLLPPRSEKAGEIPYFMQCPSGFPCGDHALHLMPGSPPASLLGAFGNRMAPFSVEFWYRFDDIETEHYIFDCGIEGLETNNRVYLYFDGEGLVFRVADGTIPSYNFIGDEPVEHAEIRYDFEELPLEEGVFYHIACMAVGTKPSDLCLFVDGVSRGKRAFMTRLSDDLSDDEGSSETKGVNSYRPSSKIKVEDATSFPSRDGVIRIGDEIIEYTSRANDTFMIDPSYKDPFGGRNRRGSRSGPHDVTSAVELYGYVATLMSEIIPQGDQTLAINLGPFRVARINNDGSSLDLKDIYIDTRLASAQPLIVGKGFLGNDNTGVLPLQGVSNQAINDDVRDTFSPSGGYALLFSEFPDNIVNAPVKPIAGSQVSIRYNYTKQRFDNNRPRTPVISGIEDQTYYVNGISVIYYDRFTGAALEGVKWGRGPDGQPKGFIESGGGSGHSALASLRNPRAFVIRYENEHVGSEVEFPRIFVIPISVSVGEEANMDLFEDYHSSPESPYIAAGSKSEILQIGVNFEQEALNTEQTEWIRYDSIERNRFCRENLNDMELNSLWNYLSPKEMINAEGAYLEEADLSDRVNRIIHFRGQHGTVHSRHSMDAKVLPVFRMFWDPSGKIRPGRNDFVTLINGDGETDVVVEPESHRINYTNAYMSFSSSENSGGGDGIYHDRDHGPCVLVGLRNPVVGEFRRSEAQLDNVIDDLLKRLETKKDDLEALWSDELEPFFLLDSRSYTRMIKFPSGELPSETPETFALGGNIVGETSPAPGVIDEVRFRQLETPHSALPKHFRYVLDTEIDEDEDDHLKVHTDRLNRNAGMKSAARRLTAVLVEEFKILKSLPTDAGYLQINDEILAYTDVDIEEGLISLAPNGRGVLGTEPAYHHRGSSVILLNFPEASILQNRLSGSDALIALESAENFPAQGAVLINEEVIGYSRGEDDFLFMPQGVSAETGRNMGLLRGRFGTAPSSHLSGEVVYSLPVRYLDLYPALQHETVEGSELNGRITDRVFVPPLADAPEAAFFPFGVQAPGAFFNELTWVEERQGPGAYLDLRVRIGGVEDWSVPPSASRNLFSFCQGAEAESRFPLLRQGDRIDVRVYTRYMPGAFDPLDYMSNAWKYAPRLKALGVEYVQPTRIIRHEEWQ